MLSLMTILTGIVVGILITIPLGPTSLYIAHRTLKGETVKALLVSIGAVLVDVFYCLIITMGLISFLHPYLQNPVVQVVFSVFLIGYGIKMLFFERRRHLDAAELEQEVVAPARLRALSAKFGGVVIGISMTLANPTLFFSWVAVLSFVTAHGLLPATTGYKVLFSVSVGVGSMVWFLGLILFMRSRRHAISDSFIRRASAVTALVIIGFGVYFTFTIFQHLHSSV
ncbi:MAG TPA: LysE family transporter [Bacteroidota bacterium]|nr:LysE family transporter [Bacteroidota bacterium]